MRRLHKNILIKKTYIGDYDLENLEKCLLCEMGHSGPLLALTPPTDYKSPSLTTPPTHVICLCV